MCTIHFVDADLKMNTSMNEQAFIEKNAPFSKRHSITFSVGVHASKQKVSGIIHDFKQSKRSSF